MTLPIQQSDSFFKLGLPFEGTWTDTENFLKKQLASEVASRDLQALDYKEISKSVEDLDGDGVLDVSISLGVLTGTMVNHSDSKDHYLADAFYVLVNREGEAVFINSEGKKWNLESFKSSVEKRYSGHADPRAIRRKVLQAFKQKISPLSLENLSLEDKKDLTKDGNIFTQKMDGGLRTFFQPAKEVREVSLKDVISFICCGCNPERIMGYILSF